MRTTARSGTWLLAVVTALALAGCGNDSADPADAAGSTSSSATDEPTRDHEDHEKHGGHGGHGNDDEPSLGPTSATERPGEDGVEVEIEISEGEVSPAGEQVDATVGDGVVLQVDSDTAEELHVHTAPEEHQYPVRAVKDQQFRFTVEQPGQFDIELHESGVLVAQLVVRP